jgi:hypothetical protein
MLALPLTRCNSNILSTYHAAHHAADDVGEPVVTAVGRCELTGVLGTGPEQTTMDRRICHPYSCHLC